MRGVGDIGDRTCALKGGSFEFEAMSLFNQPFNHLKLLGVKLESRA